LIRQEDEDEQEEDEDEQDEEDDLQGQQGIPQHQDNIAAGGGGGAFVVGGADNGGAQAVENLPGGNRILGLVEPGRMEITPTERQQALAIKAAANNCHELDPVKDFLYAQLALIDGDDIEKALERLHHMQYFKQEYAINDTAEDGNQIFREYLRLLPKFHLCFTYNHDGGNYVVVYDNAAFDKSVFNTEAKVRCWLGGTYYTLIAMNPDFEAVRRGTIMILECEGLSWSRIFLDGLKRMVSEVVAIHPLRVEKVKYFNAGVTMTTVSLVCSGSWLI